MNNFLKIGMLSLSLFVMGHLLAQAGSGPHGVLSTQTADATGEEIVVTVDGVPITHRQLEAEFRPELEKILPVAQGGRVPEAILEPYKKRLRQLVLEKMIEERLLDKKVKEAKIVISDKETNRELTRRAAKKRPPISVEEYKGRVEASGRSFDDLKQRIRRDLGYKKFFEKQFAAKLDVSEEDARKHYADHKRLFDRPAQVRASHIVIKPKDFESEGTDPAAAKAKAAARADDLLKQIKAGADFEKLARENATSPSRKDSGDLGYISKGQAPPDFEKAAFALKAGEVSGVLETRDGYQIIKVTDKKAAVSGFDNVKNDAMKDLKARRLSGLVNQYVQSLKAGAKIVYPPGKEPALGKPPVPGKKAVRQLKTPVQSKEKPGSR